MTSYFNGQIPLYISESEIINVQAEIDQLQIDVSALQFDITTLAGEVGILQTDVDTLQSNNLNINSSLAGSMVQYYKVPLPSTESPLVGSTYTVVEGYTASSIDIPTIGNFVVASPGILQYIGPSTFYFKISYQVTASIDSGNFNCIFLLFKNIDELTSSRQTISMDNVGSHNLESANGSALTPLSPGDTISLRAQLLDSGLPNVLNIYDLSLNIFKIPTI